MFRKMGVMATAWLISLMSGYAGDEGVEKALKNLVAVMREEANLKKKDANGDEEVDKSKINALFNLEETARNSDFGSRALEQQLGYVESQFSQSAKDAAIKLREQIRLRDKEADDFEIAKAEDLIERVTQIVKSAKEPADLDVILVELGKRRYSASGNRPSPKLQETNGILDSVRFFATNWQDYLSARNEGDVERARSALGSIKSADRSVIVPRSELLALERSLPSEDERVSKIVLGIKTLEEIRPVIIKLGEFTRRSNVGSVSDIIRCLSGIDDNYRELKEGLPPSLQFNFQRPNYIPPGITSKFIELQAQYYRVAIPIYVGAPKELIANEAESVTAFIDRMEEFSVVREDIELRVKVRGVRRAISEGPYVMEDMNGFHFYTAGKNQELAGQYELAVGSYQQALRTGHELVPVRAIGERLAAIKTEHPEEYKAGVERFMNPPPPRYPAGSPYGANPAYSPQQGGVKAESQKKESAPTTSAPSKPGPPKTPAEH